MITKMHVADHGELEARISLGGDTVPVTRRSGSWMVQHPDGTVSDILRQYAEALQIHARERGFIDRHFHLTHLAQTNGRA